jgi:hypothetical protein
MGRLYLASGRGARAVGLKIWKAAISTVENAPVDPVRALPRRESRPFLRESARSAATLAARNDLQKRRGPAAKPGLPRSTCSETPQCRRGCVVPGTAHDQVAISVDQRRLSNSGSLAMLTAIRRAAPPAVRKFPARIKKGIAMISKRSMLVNNFRPTIFGSTSERMNK